MAHNLNVENGRVSMAYQGETPWHKLGTRLDSITSVEQALAAAGLDYTVREEPLYLKDSVLVPIRLAVLRDDNNALLSTVGADYQILQHTEGFRALEVLTERHGMTIEAAGALGAGERVWMLFKMPVTIAPVPGDDVRGYLLATTGHDGKTAHVVKPTGIRVVCQNTLDAASLQGGVDFVRLFHAKGNELKLADSGKVVDKVVDKIVGAFQASGETFAKFAQRRMTDVEVIKFVETLFPQDAAKPSPVIDERRRKVADLVWTGVGSDLARSATDGAPNVWAAYNAVTEYFDHVRTGEAKSAAGVKAANASAIFGGNAAIKLAALKLSRQLVAA